MYWHKIQIINADFLYKVHKKPKNLDSRIFKTKSNRLIMQSKCAVCERKSRFVKEQEAKGLISKLGLKTWFNTIRC